MSASNYWEILSIKYRHQVRKLIEPLKLIPNFSGIAIGIVVKSGRSAVLSSTPRVTLQTVNSGLSRSEILLNFEYIKKPRLISPKHFEDLDIVQKELKKVLSKYHVYRGYCYSRSCEDCCIIVAFNTRSIIKNHQDLYLNTKDIVLPFIIRFIDEMLYAYLTKVPELKYSRFATDKHYRHNILNSDASVLDFETLTDKELAILYWTAKGKSANDIALILSLSKNTIDSYRREIIQKLNVTNITQAVHLAIQTNMIV